MASVEEPEDHGTSPRGPIPVSNTLSHLTCKEIILNHLGEYLDGTLSLEIVADLEWHLARCPACVAYLNTYKKTQEFTRKVGSVVMAEDMKSRLQEFLLSRLVHEGPCDA